MLFFSLLFPLLFTWDWCIMGYHVVHLFYCAVKLYSLTTFLTAARAGLFFVVWPLCGVLGGVFLEYFAIFCRVPGAMQQACFPSDQPIAGMAYIFCLALASTALLGVGRQGGFSSV